MRPRRTPRAGESMPSSATMKAVVLHGADDMHVEAWPRPAPARRGTAEGRGRVDLRHRREGAAPHAAGQPAGQFVMGHEYAGTIAALGPGVDEFRVGDRVAVEVHKGCDRCEKLHQGLVTPPAELRRRREGHRAKGLTCDGGFASTRSTTSNTLYRRRRNLTFEQACMVTTAASPLWAIDLMGGYVAGRDGPGPGPGPIGSSPCSSARPLAAARVILNRTREARLAIGRQLARTSRSTYAGRACDEPDSRAPGRARRRLRARVAPADPRRCRRPSKNVKRGGRIGVVAWYNGPVEVDMTWPLRSNVRIYAARGEAGMNCGSLARADEQGQDPGRSRSSPHFRLNQIHDAFRTYTSGSATPSRSCSMSSGRGRPHADHPPRAR